MHLEVILELTAYYRVKLMEINICDYISVESKALDILQTFHEHLRSFCIYTSVREEEKKGNYFTFLVNNPSILFYEADSKPEPLSG